MIPLKLHQRVWSWLCMHPPSKSVSTAKKLASILFTFSMFVSLLSLSVSSVAFITQFMSTDLEGSLHALFHWTICSGMIYTFMIRIISRHKMNAIFDQLAEIHVKTKNYESYRYLMAANNMSEWMWLFYFKFMIMIFIVSESFATLIAIFCLMKHGTFDVQYLYHPFKVVLPWNCETPFGYIGEIAFHTVTGQTYLFLNGAIMLLFIAMCLHHQTFYKMFCHSLRKFESMDNQRNQRPLLCELIQFHNLVKSWMLESVEAYSSFVLIQLASLTIGIACILFQLDLQLKDIGVDICILLMATAACASNPFLYCYFGKSATESYANMADQLFECNWQKLPIDLQKYLLLMIGNMQRPLYYHGFGIIVLDLETFCNLFRTVITYYMMFKTLTDN